ncbi:MAG TPA: hypothetical protein VF829_01020, partial [Candidatus Paceibacterota bacterium]
CMNVHEYAPVLWDIAEGDRASLPDEFVLRRVLAYGTIGLILSAMRSYGADAVQRVFAGMRPTAMHARRYHYLQKYLLV